MSSQHLSIQLVRNYLQELGTDFAGEIIVGEEDRWRSLSLIAMVNIFLRVLLITSGKLDILLWSLRRILLTDLPVSRKRLWTDGRVHSRFSCWSHGASRSHRHICISGGDYFCDAWKHDGSSSPCYEQWSSWCGFLVSSLMFRMLPGSLWSIHTEPLQIYSQSEVWFSLQSRIWILGNMKPILRTSEVLFSLSER